jgi:hypothetical protein
MKTKTCFQIYPPLKGRLAPQLKPTTETTSTTTNFIMITAGLVLKCLSFLEIPSINNNISSVVEF